MKKNSLKKISFNKSIISRFQSMHIYGGVDKSKMPKTRDEFDGNDSIGEGGQRSALAPCVSDNNLAC